MPSRADVRSMRILQASTTPTTSSGALAQSAALNGVGRPLHSSASSRNSRQWECPELACIIERSISSLILFRVLQGLAGGGLQPSSQGILLDTFPQEKQGTAQNPLRHRRALRARCRSYAGRLDHRRLFLAMDLSSSISRSACSLWASARPSCRFADDLTHNEAIPTSKRRRYKAAVRKGIDIRTDIIPIDVRSAIRQIDVRSAILCPWKCQYGVPNSLVQ